jgi:hypothetical protein
MKHKCHHGLVFGHEVHDRSRQEYDIKLYQDYFFDRPTYLDKFLGDIFE